MDHAPLRRAAFRLFSSILAAWLLLPAPGASAQSNDADLPTVTRTFAIENARIVQAPGRVIERGTVVVRDGLIMAVGARVDIPFDAERIAGDSLVVYAGFIDGLSHAGIPEPKEEQNFQRPDNPGEPTNEQAGILPDRDVRELLDPADKSVADLRKAGFGAAQVMPYGRMLPGNSALILLTGQDAGKMVLRGDVALTAQFTPARQMYPGTPMGVMAKMRQLYHEAERRHRIESLYAENPAGLERPSYDAAHYAFFPVIEGKKPILYFVDSALETYRALRLQADLGFPLILAGLNQGFDAVDELKAARPPLFLTLDLPEDPKWMAKLKEDSLDVIIASYNREERAATYRDLEAEKRNLQARQLMSREQYLATAATFHENGLSFGFSTMGAKPADLHKNLRKLIDNGLPEDVALAALTTTPAQILGISQILGTIDQGKIANLVVATGPYFEEKTQIKYVVVDGTRYEYELKKETPKRDDADEPATPGS